MFSFFFSKNLIEHPGKTITFIEKHIYKQNISYISVNFRFSYISVSIWPCYERLCRPYQSDSASSVSCFLGRRLENYRTTSCDSICHSKLP